MRQVKLDEVKERSHPKCRGYCELAHFNGVYCLACGRMLDSKAEEGEL